MRGYFIPEGDPDAERSHKVPPEIIMFYDREMEPKPLQVKTTLTFKITNVEFFETSLTSIGNVVYSLSEDLVISPIPE